MRQFSSRSKEFTLREARAEDIPAMNALIQRSMLALGAEAYPDPQDMEGILSLVGVDSLLVELGTYFAVEHERVIVACGGWSDRKKLYGNDAHAVSTERLDPQSEPARMRAFFIAPEWAGYGLGTFLLHHAEECARAAGFQVAELGATASGIPVYLKLGYEVIGVDQVKAPNGRLLPITRMRRPL